MAITQLEGQQLQQQLQQLMGHSTSAGEVLSPSPGTSDVCAASSGEDTVHDSYGSMFPTLPPGADVDELGRALEQLAVQELRPQQWQQSLAYPDHIAMAGMAPYISQQQQQQYATIRDPYNLTQSLNGLSVASLNSSSIPPNSFCECGSRERHLLGPLPRYSLGQLEQRGLVRDAMRLLESMSSCSSSQEQQPQEQWQTQLYGAIQQSGGHIALVGVQLRGQMHDLMATPAGQEHLRHLFNTAGGAVQM